MTIDLRDFLFDALLGRIDVTSVYVAAFLTFIFGSPVIIWMLAKERK